jgi:hypothetical protein
MIQIAYTQVRAAASVCALLASLLVPVPAAAVRVDGIYAASAPAADDSVQARRNALTEALRRVLVKASGRASAGGDAELLARFGDPSALVQQFRRDADGQVWAQFDSAAVRRGLESAGFPVWGDDRPLTAVWLTFDSGAGERDLLAGRGDGTTPEADALRRELLEAAAARGVPLVLPLGDSQDLAALSRTDVSGDVVESIIQASARYRADAVLIGQGRLYRTGTPEVSWTLVAGGERSEWRGNVADGALGLADRLAERLVAGPASGAGRVRLSVSRVTTFEDYGLVLGHLRGVSVIESVDVAGVAGDTVVFVLGHRGGQEQLVSALALRRLLEPEEAASAEQSTAPERLRYRLGTRR